MIFDCDCYKTSWLKKYATRSNIVGFSTDKLINFLNLPNTPSRTMALGLTQPVRQSIPEIFLGGGSNARPPRLYSMGS
jgi:hypothetical protein